MFNILSISYWIATLHKTKEPIEISTREFDEEPIPKIMKYTEHCLQHLPVLYSAYSRVGEKSTTVFL